MTEFYYEYNEYMNVYDMDTLGPTKGVLILQISLCTKGLLLNLNYVWIMQVSSFSSVYIKRFTVDVFKALGLIHSDDNVITIV